MDCPHCAAENLNGVAVCSSCGKSMRARPRFLHAQDLPAASDAAPEAAAPTLRSPSIRSASDELTRSLPLWGQAGAPTPVADVPASPSAGPVAPSPVPAAPASGGALCRVCMSPFERAPGDAKTAICPSCRALSPTPERLAQNDVAVVPSTIGADAPERDRNGRPRPRPVAVRRVGLSGAAIAILVAAGLCVAGLAVVVVRASTPDRAVEIAGDLRAEELTVGAEVTDHFAPRYECRIALHAVRDDAAGIGGSMLRRIDLRQTSVQTCVSAVASRDGGTVVLETTPEGSVESQTGTVPGGDGREYDAYPWGGPRKALRVRVAPTKPAARADGEPTVAGRDVPPLLHLGALGPATTTFAPEARWRADVVLPVVTNRDVRLAAAAFPTDVQYAGKSMKDGVLCGVFLLRGRAPARLPAPIDDQFNRSSGTIAGAVWIDPATGFAVAADVEFALELRREAGRVEEVLALDGRLTLSRR